MYVQMRACGCARKSVCGGSGCTSVLPPFPHMQQSVVALACKNCNRCKSKEEEDEEAK